MEEKKDLDVLLSPIYSWTVPERIWKPKEKIWYVSYSMFFVVLIAFFALLQEYLLIVAIISFVFLWFVQASIPPFKTEHIITKVGIKSFEKLYSWRNIKKFWISLKDNTFLLNLDTVEEEKPELMKRVSLLLDNNEKEVFDILIKHVDYGEQKEIGYNFFTKVVFGKYIDPTKYSPKGTSTQKE